MADSKITALASIGTGTDPANDQLVIVDVSDVLPTGMATTGTTKRVSLNNLLASSPTATLASATITGDLTVRTNKLAVTSTGVGIGTASPSVQLHLAGPDAINVLFAGVTKGIRFSQSASTSLIVGVDNTGALSYQPLSIGGSALDFSLSGTTAMTLNSTGLGVGVVPSLRLELNSATNTTAGVLVRNQTTVCGFFGNEATYTGTGSSNNTVAAAYGANSFIIATNSATRFAIDSSGNVGIGVTPSAISNVIRLEIGGALSTNLTLRSSSTNAAARNWMVGANVNAFGDFVIRQGNSQNAEPNSGTDRLVLDASGRLLVGKTTGVNSIETVGAGVDGRGTVTGVSTVATTIYTIKQSATAAMCVVFGDDGTNGFCDIVLFLATVAPKVVSSQTLYGSPAARTYSASTTNLQLALASGTLSIRTAALSTLNT